MRLIISNSLGRRLHTGKPFHQCGLKSWKESIRNTEKNRIDIYFFHDILPMIIQLKKEIK
jgi:aryl-alcohol dehydrogenase-like predicted oxidoreductase